MYENREMPTAFIGGIRITVSPEGILSESEQEHIFIPKQKIHGIITSEQGLFIQTGSAKIPITIWKFKPSPWKRAFEFIYKNLFQSEESLPDSMNLLDLDSSSSVSFT